MPLAIRCYGASPSQDHHRTVLEHSKRVPSTLLSPHRCPPGNAAQDPEPQLAAQWPRAKKEMRMWAHSPRELHLRTAPATRRCRADLQELVDQGARQIRQRKGRHRQHLHRVPDRRQMSPCEPAEREVDSRISIGPRPSSVQSRIQQRGEHATRSLNRAATCASALPETAWFHGRQQIPSTMRSGVKVVPRSRNSSTLDCFVQGRPRHTGSPLAYDERSVRRSSTSFPRRARFASAVHRPMLFFHLFFFRRFIRVVNHRCGRRLSVTSVLHSNGKRTADQ